MKVKLSTTNITWDPKKIILWRRSMLVVSSSSNLGRYGDEVLLLTAKLETSQLVDKVCAIEGELFATFMQVGLLVLIVVLVLVLLAAVRKWVFDRDWFEKKSGFENEDAVKLISIFLFGFVCWVGSVRESLMSERETGSKISCSFFRFVVIRCRTTATTTTLKAMSFNTTRV